MFAAATVVAAAAAAAAAAATSTAAESVVYRTTRVAVLSWKLRTGAHGVCVYTHAHKEHRPLNTLNK